jgi:hypothetical protein
MTFVPVFATCLLLAAVSVTEVGLVSDMVSFLHIQKWFVKTYQINWPNESIPFGALPAHLWLDQGHTTNGAAGYGFVLGIFGLFVAWRQRNRNGKPPSRSLFALTILLLLSTLFTLSALIFTFTVTNETSGQTIDPSLAQPNQHYPADKWTPETWYKALLNTPIADPHKRSEIRTHVHLFEAWRWMLIPLFLADVAALAAAVMGVLRQRKSTPLDYPPEK